MQFVLPHRLNKFQALLGLELIALCRHCYNLTYHYHHVTCHRNLIQEELITTNASAFDYLGSNTRCHSLVLGC